MDPIFQYPYRRDLHGPHYDIGASEQFAASFVLENRDEFAAWLLSRGIDPADALAWAGREIALHSAAERALADWAIAPEGAG